MIKLKDLLRENSPSNIFIPRRAEDRIERLIKIYIKNGSQGDLQLNNMNLTKLPEILKTVEVGGNFYCNENKLTSLDGAPKSIGGNFDCSGNNLTSLVGSPKFVGGNFSCGSKT